MASIEFINSIFKVSFEPSSIPCAVAINAIRSQSFRLRDDGSNETLKIEFINSIEAKDEIDKSHHYLDIVGMDEIPEIKDYVKKTYYPLDEPIDDDKLQEAVKGVLSKGNIFELWLRAKGEKMFNDGLPLDTDSSDFKDFIITGMKGGAN